MDHYIPFTHSKPNDPTCSMCEAGFPVKTNSYVSVVERVQFRFPRSKKVRIRKKWAKDLRNWRYILGARVLKMNADHLTEFLKKLATSPVVSLDIETTVVARKNGDQIEYRRL